MYRCGCWEGGGYMDAGDVCWVMYRCGGWMGGGVCVTFGVCIYSLAGLLIVVLLWVLFTSVSYVVIAMHAG